MALIKYILHPCTSSVLFHNLGASGRIYTDGSKLAWTLYLG
jgi:hypothetical protein